jgi:protein-disulfide isomerase
MVALCFLLLAALPALAHGPQMEGRADSPVKVLIYEDLQCPDCARFRMMLDQKLMPTFGADVVFVHRDFPLAKHAWARPAAIAARYFGGLSPELGLRFRRYCADNLAGIQADNFGAKVAAFARANGADPEKATAALADPKLDAVVEKDIQDGVARGVSKTPTVIVNGQPFIETFTVEEISKAIEDALKSAR